MDPQRLNSPRIYTLKRLSNILGFDESKLQIIAKSADSYYREFSQIVKGKQRDLIEAKGGLKVIQNRILARILSRIEPFEHSYGAIKGRSAKDNALLHAGGRYIAKLDIKSFYPSVRYDRVYEFFSKTLGYTPDVSRIMTQLTTYKHALPLGSSTSPILADLIVSDIDERINALAKKHGLTYSRYVDDLTLSGDFGLERIYKTVITILRQCGFKAKRSKLTIYEPGDKQERTITGVRIIKGNVSAPSHYVIQLENELQAAIMESRQRIPQGDFGLKQHYRGRIGYVQWLDKKLGDNLFRLYRKVKWKHLEWAKDK